MLYTIESLKALDMDPKVRGHFPAGISSSEQTRERIERNQINFEEKGYCDFTVVHKDSGRFAGRSGFGDITGGEVRDASSKDREHARGRLHLLLTSTFLRDVGVLNFFLSTIKQC